MEGMRNVVIDGESAKISPICAFRGLGAISANNSSRLLMDYKENDPEAYGEIMEALFRPDYGAGLSHVKIELGADVNSSSGTEPCTKRTADEKADVTRGAGFTFAADAKKINPDITLDLLRWGEPAWVSAAFENGRESGFEARYSWYIETIEAAYDTYGLEFDFISADANETETPDEDWIIYFSDRLKSERNGRYDYSKIKIVASDETGTRKIAERMAENEDLRNAVDVIGIHYTTFGDQNTELLRREYGKEIWYSEGIAPCNESSLSVNADGSGISGINSVIDVTNRIINSYCRGKMNMYEYQPAVSAYYDGVNYSHKQLITANEPWSGYYTIGSGLWGAAHITHFVKKGWKYVDSACFGDGDENHFITNTTANHMTLMSDEGDYTIVLTNDSSEPRKYFFKLKNMPFPEKELKCIETRDPEPNGRFDENWFRLVDKITPYESHGEYEFYLDVQPCSIMTVTTLDAGSVNGTETVKIPTKKSGVLSLPYIENFSYSDDLLSLRGNAPFYMTDQGGAFEIVRFEDENVLEQIITSDAIPTDWRFGKTPNPVTCFGDDRWCDCSFRAEVMFGSVKEDNYAAIGVRYNSSVTVCETAECGYQLSIYPDGAWQLKYMDNVVEKGYESSISKDGWNSLRISADGGRIKCFVNKEIVCDHITAASMITSGRAALYSGFYRNRFRAVSVTPILGSPSFCERIDCLSDRVSYSEGWIKNAADSFSFYNRTSAAVKGENESLSFEFYGENFSVLGEASDIKLKIEVDDRILSAGYSVSSCGAKQVFYAKRGLPLGEHTARITVLSGELKLDTIEVSVNSHESKNVYKRKIRNNTVEKKPVKAHKMRKITIFIGAGIAAAAAGTVIAVKKIKNISSKKLDK